MMYNRINAPIFAYYTVYGKYPNPPIWGREVNHETKLINGIPIDVHIPSNAIKKLLDIKDIESRASCEGKDERHLTFFIFRPKIQDLDYVKALCESLRSYGLKCKYDKGVQKQYRICISEKLWYSDKNKDKFERWWNDLPKKLIKALNSVKSMKEIHEFNTVLDAVYKLEEYEERLRQIDGIVLKSVLVHENITMDKLRDIYVYRHALKSSINRIYNIIRRIIENAGCG